VLIVEHQLGTKQVRASELSTAEIDAVAGGARHRVERPASFDDRGVCLGALLGRENGRLAAATSLTAPGSAPWLSLWLSRRLRLTWRRWLCWSLLRGRRLSLRQQGRSRREHGLEQETSRSHRE
jgi:hypothetical protein